MKLIVQTFLMLMLSYSLLAQNVVQGTVTSNLDNNPIKGVKVALKGTSLSTLTDINGEYKLKVSDLKGKLVFSFSGYNTMEVNINGRSKIDIKLKVIAVQVTEELILEEEVMDRRATKLHDMSFGMAAPSEIKDHFDEVYINHNTEEYDAISENKFVSPLDHPLSTFSIDVDNASYSNIRRFLNYGQRPPVDAVRIEEMINYFNYEYADPTDEHPFAVHTELSYAPWASRNMLFKIGLQGRHISEERMPSSNLVFLIDVSGSMDADNKLPLLKQSFRLLVDKLRSKDKVAIVVYAGAAGLILPSTSGAQKEEILASLSRLTAGGSTAGGAGIKLAYQIAKENFIENGNNRIILATDGDFNIGESSNAAMERLIEEKREQGIYLTVLGYGMGNYKDSKMEILADKGNGNYAYIDNLQEAQKVLVDQMAGTLLTIAKDVKLQLEFNPNYVKAYRLIGYENRKLNKEDFNDDKKDAGEMGAGHTVTALYELIPADGDFKGSNVDPLKYQSNKEIKPSKSDELLTIKVRYKKPDESNSIRLEKVIENNPIALNNASENFHWASAVAGYGMILRNSEFVRDYPIDDVLELATNAKGSDEFGYRIEFINLIKSTRLLARD